MSRPAADESDVARILAKRHDNGADFWSGPEGKIYVGNPFSTLGSLNLLHELGVGADHEAVAGALDLVREACRDDGRVRLGPKAPLYPCYTAEAARVLCRFGPADDPHVARTVTYLAETAHDDGGWRCDFKRTGSGPGTECSNPGATLYVLDVLRHLGGFREGDGVTDAAVDRLLRHWTTREPEGPCRWGIGTLFLQVEYPFLRYNLFFFVYVLSFFASARADERFHDAFAVLDAARDDAGRMVVARPHRALKGLAFCAKGEPSAAATRRFREIEANLVG